MKTIEQFQGEYRFLSNFWPVRVLWDGQEYRSVEHAYQAAKTLDFAQRRAIQDAPTPRDAKRWGRRITIRPNWDEDKLDVMLCLLRQKFDTHHPALRAALASTSDAKLVEGNNWNDRYWGVSPVGSGIGSNRLGQLLMIVRQEIQP